jgi:hypothetical protein
MNEIEKAEEFADMTLYHIPKALALSFKEFCRIHASNKYGIGLEVLLNSFKDKESYFYLLDSLNTLNKDVEELKKELGDLRGEFATKISVKEVVKTFGKEY